MATCKTKNGAGRLDRVNKNINKIYKTHKNEKLGSSPLHLRWVLE
jgi:hypothetical protein